MSKPHEVSRGMSHATRAAYKAKKEPVPLTETPPLTFEQARILRLASEQASRDEIKRLNQEWAVHQARVRMGEIGREQVSS